MCWKNCIMFVPCTNIRKVTFSSSVHTPRHCWQKVWHINVSTPAKQLLNWEGNITLWLNCLNATCDEGSSVDKRLSTSGLDQWLSLELYNWLSAFHSLFHVQILQYWFCCEQSLMTEKDRQKVPPSVFILLIMPSCLMYHQCMYLLTKMLIV